MGVRIVTDSTADIPPDLVEQYRITIVPLSVIFGDEVLKDGIDISTAIGRMVAQILAAIGEYDRQQKAERIRDGVRARAGARAACTLVEHSGARAPAPAFCSGRGLALSTPFRVGRDCG